MLKNRVIPCLLLMDDGLVKTKQFSSPQYVGDPINAIRIFNDKEVDELIVLDITASKANKNPNYKLIEEFASECFMPLSYGGGIKSLDQAKRLFDLGIEKVCLQTAAINNPQLITEIAEVYGSQSVVVSVDVKKAMFGGYKLYSSSAKKNLARNWLEFIDEVVSAGAGEIVINAVDRDGLMNGMDLNLINLAASAVPVPVIALGGAGELSDFKKAVDAGASAVAAGAMFVYQKPHRAVLITYPEYQALENLFSE